MHRVYRLLYLTLIEISFKLNAKENDFIDVLLMCGVSFKTTAFENAVCSVQSLSCLYE